MFDKGVDPVVPARKEVKAPSKPTLMEKNSIVGTTILLAWGWAVLGVGFLVAGSLI